MAKVEKFSPTLAKLEGGYVNHPLDKGGPTNMGVILTTFQAFYGKNKTADDLKNITTAQYNHILKVGYWDKCKADFINNQSIANIFVDMAYNSGSATAIKKMQSVLVSVMHKSIAVDGKMGPNTLNAINSSDQKALFDAFKTARQQFYDKTVANNPSQKVFYKGWCNRLKHFSFEP